MQKENGYGYSCNHVTAKVRISWELSINGLIIKHLQLYLFFFAKPRGYMVTAVTVTISGILVICFFALASVPAGR
jgi:hypothetical protein